MKHFWLIGFLLLPSTALFAETKTWVGPSGSNWTNAASWSPNGVPAAADDIVFNSTTTVVFTANVNEFKSLTISNSADVLFESDGAVFGFVKGAPLTINAGSKLKLRRVRIQLDGASLVNGTLDMLTGMAETRLNAQVGSTATITVNGKVRVGSEKYQNLDQDAVGLFGTGAKNSVLFNSGSEYEIARTGGQSGITPATWARDAILKITEATSTNSYGLYWHPTAGEHEIGTFIWDCPNQGSNVNIAFAVWPYVTLVKGDFIINNTNGKLLQFTTANNVNYNATFKGDFKILTSNSPLYLYGSGGTPNSNYAVNLTFEKNLDCRSQLRFGSNTSTNHTFQFNGSASGIGGTGPQSIGILGFDKDWVLDFYISNEISLSNHLGKLKSTLGGKAFLGNYNLTAGGGDGALNSQFITNGTGYLIVPIASGIWRNLPVSVSDQSSDAVSIMPAANDTFSVRVKGAFSNPVANAARVHQREWNIVSNSTSAMIALQPGGDGIDPAEEGSWVIGHYKNGAWTETATTEELQFKANFNSFSPFGAGLAGGFVGGGSITTYTFTGNGNWSDTANWTNNTKPPNTITSTIKVIINPPNEGSCILDVPITISNGGNISVSPGKKFVLNSKVKIL
jgi:hypothetical protein